MQENKNEMQNLQGPKSGPAPSCKKKDCLHQKKNTLETYTIKDLFLQATNNIKHKKLLTSKALDRSSS